MSNTKFWITGRRIGKTFQIVQWMKKHPEGMCIVFSVVEAERIAREYKIPKDRFITPRQLIDGGLRGRNRRNQIDLAVDNLELVLDAFTYPAGIVRFATATGENYQPRLYSEYQET